MCKRITTEENKRIGGGTSQGKTRKRGGGSSRGYNVRKYKECPHQHTKKSKPNYTDLYKFPTVQKVVDLTFCPTCGSALSNPTGSYTRKTEDVTDGRWTRTEWTIMRRYCKSCCKQHSARPLDVLSEGLFGTTIMSQVFIMRSLAIPYEKIQTLIHMMFGKSITVSAIMNMCNTAADKCLAYLIYVLG